MAREYIYDLRMTGTISIAQWNDLRHLPYTENMVNLLLVEDPGQLNDDEMRRVLAPNGIGRMRNRDGQWRTVRKPWPPGMDGWSHWNHGADGNPS